MTGTAEKIILFLYSQPKEKVWEIKEHREKRSLDSNAFYWLLIGKLARKLHVSTARLHNLMLRECAPPYLIDGHIAMQPIPDTEQAENQVLESSTYHLKPTAGIITGNDGQAYRWYVVLCGSSTFNSVEMNALIARIVEACDEQGIQTATPDELAEMAALWEKHNAQAHKSNCNTDGCKA